MMVLSLNKEKLLIVIARVGHTHTEHFVGVRFEFDAGIDCYVVLAILVVVNRQDIDVVNPRFTTTNLDSRFIGLIVQFCTDSAIAIAGIGFEPFCGQANWCLIPAHDPNGFGFDPPLFDVMTCGSCQNHAVSIDRCPE